MDLIPYTEYYTGNDREQFERGILDISRSIGILPEWLAMVFFQESAMRPDNFSPYTNAGGLIGFMPFTAAELGTTVENIRALSGADQLPYVFEFYRKYSGRISGPDVLYLATFYPRAMFEDDNFILGSEVSQARAELIARQNKIYDIDGDGVITRGEVVEYLRKKYPEVMTKTRAEKMGRAVLLSALILIFLGVVTLFLK